jgi:hypothetical protein
VISSPDKDKSPHESEEDLMKVFYETSVIDWNKYFEFVSVDRSISNVISRVSSEMGGNITEVIPCRFFYLEPEEARHIIGA